MARSWTFSRVRKAAQTDKGGHSFALQGATAVCQMHTSARRPSDAVPRCRKIRTSVHKQVRRQRETRGSMTTRGVGRTKGSRRGRVTHSGVGDHRRTAAATNPTDQTEGSQTSQTADHAVLNNCTKEPEHLPCRLSEKHAKVHHHPNFSMVHHMLRPTSTSQGVIALSPGESEFLCSGERGVSWTWSSLKAQRFGS